MVNHVHSYGRTYSSISISWPQHTNNEWEVTTTDLLHALPNYYSSKPYDSSIPSFSIALKNDGNFSTPFVVLCFGSNEAPNSPRKQLVGFERIENIDPSESKIVTVQLIPTALIIVDQSGTSWITSSKYTIVCGGAPDGFANGTLEISGQQHKVFTY